jgi:hypothetical protein
MSGTAAAIGWLAFVVMVLLVAIRPDLDFPADDPVSARPWRPVDRLARIERLLTVIVAVVLINIAAGVLYVLFVVL